MTAILVVTSLVLVGVVVLLVGLLRSHAAILRRLHELELVGSEAPRRADPVEFRPMPGMPEPVGLTAFPTGADIVGVDLAGDAMVVGVVGASHATVLAFLSSGCTTCQRFWEAFADLDALHLPDNTRLVVVVKGVDAESPSVLRSLVPAGLTVVMSSRAWNDYAVPGSPYFTLVDGRTGTVRGEGTGLDWAQVAGLLAQATGDLRFTMGDRGRRIPKPASDAEREEELDRALFAVGIEPGDPSLYQRNESADEAPGPPTV